MDEAPDPIRSVSYGGGVQSTALLVLAAERVIDFPTFLFANVGDDSEMPETVRYVREVAIPYGAAHGIEVHELHRRTRDGEIETLWGRLMKEGSRSLPIPVRMSNGAPGNRSCTADFKIRVVGKWLKQHGASEANPAHIGIGISTDEIERTNNRRLEKHEITEYPLIELGLNRNECENIIRSVGLPVPPKSACFFCPFHRPSAWQALAIDHPDLFEKSVHLERTLNERREMLGKDPVWLTRFNKPLDLVVNDDQQAFVFEGPEGCDEGYCWT